MQRGKRETTRCIQLRAVAAFQTWSDKARYIEGAVPEERARNVLMNVDVDALVDILVELYTQHSNHQ